MSQHREQLLEGGGLRVRFFFHHDRYAHQIAIAEQDQWTALLESVEGTGEQDWPASPPLQSLDSQQRAGNTQLALLVGMAGKSHWSMSMELNPDTATLTFDVACRLRGTVGALGSSYRRLQANELGLSLAAEGGSATILPDDQKILVVPQATLTASLQTIRWRYKITLPGGPRQSR